MSTVPLPRPVAGPGPATVSSRFPVVGFDLDMTLVDSAEGIVATLQEAAASFGHRITPEQVWPTIGVGLEEALVGITPQADIPAVTARYRELYPQLGVPLTRLLPGAAEAIAAVRDRGGRVLVVSGKIEPAVRAVLARVGLAEAVDEVSGGLFGAGKGGRLRASGTHVYVGDHPGDIEAARVAGAASVAVSTGPYSAADLAAHGPDALLPGLAAFPDWLTGFVAEVGGADR
jgi:phosphoglycolate phosphatase